MKLLFALSVFLLSAGFVEASPVSITKCYAEIAFAPNVPAGDAVSAINNLGPIQIASSRVRLDDNAFVALISSETKEPRSARYHVSPEYIQLVIDAKVFPEVQRNLEGELAGVKQLGCSSVELK